MRMSKGRDLVLDDGNLINPRDTVIHLPIGLPHTSHVVFDEAELFKPQHWLAPDADYMPTGTDTPPILSACPSSVCLSHLLIVCYQGMHVCVSVCLFVLLLIVCWQGLPV